MLPAHWHPIALVTTGPNRRRSGWWVRFHIPEPAPYVHGDLQASRTEAYAVEAVPAESGALLRDWPRLAGGVVIMLPEQRVNGEAWRVMWGGAPPRSGSIHHHRSRYAEPDGQGREDRDDPPAPAPEPAKWTRPAPPPDLVMDGARMRCRATTTDLGWDDVQCTRAAKGQGRVSTGEVVPLCTQHRHQKHPRLYTWDGSRYRVRVAHTMS